jgi:hypothetical protein
MRPKFISIGKIMLRHPAFLALAILLSACATAREATWKTVPGANIPYERAWIIVVNTVSEYFDLETIDGQSGYLRSGWKTIDTCWAGIFQGGMVPCKRAKVTVRVEERSPFKVKVKVEKEKANPWTSYQTWVQDGNDERLQNEIMDTLAGRLRNM